MNDAVMVQLPDKEKVEKELEDPAKLLDINTLPEYKKAEEKYFEENRLKAEKDAMNLSSLEKMEQKKDREVDVKERIAEKLKDDPIKAKEVMDKELGDLDQRLITLQIKQHELLSKREGTKKELENIRIESESLFTSLGTAIKEEKYADADSLQQKINTLSECAKKTREAMQELEQNINLSELRKIEVRGVKADLLESARNLFQTWIVS